MANGNTDNVFLIWGGEGWFAGHLVALLKKQGKQVFSTTVRMENREAVLAELERVKPTHVFNCAGATGRPNVDWCEDNKEATIRSNVIGALNLADCCFLQNIHITLFGTGCKCQTRKSFYQAGLTDWRRATGVYKYDDKHKINGKPYKEVDPGNFDGSFYSATKSKVQDIMAVYPNVLILRFRMSVSDDLNGRSFVTKILKYEKIISIPNSHSILHDLLPASVLLAEHGELGVYNFTNPGVISHNEVLELFKKIVRPDITWKTFSLEEQAKVIKAGRSNCELDSAKLMNKMKEYNHQVPEIHEAYRQCFERMVANGVR
jgi:3,5-epimerase/4-reductase